ncbi:MAG: ribosome silencing factor [Oscillospiraceae bacterium]|nr:ribosome silencing factor [Oscillospiraceae bacterium]
MESLQLAKEFADAFEERIGQDIKILKVEELTTLADYFVLVSGQSNTQVRALADAAEDRLQALGLSAPRREGRGGDSWILMDAGTVIAHVFTKEAREYYQLEKLWADAETVEINDSEND